MATMGKLDAICARLKSSQQQLSSTGSNDDKDRLHDATEEDIKASLRELKKCTEAEESRCRKDVNHDVGVGRAVTAKLQLIYHKDIPEDGQGGPKVFEKVKVQGANSDVVNEHNIKDDNIISKHNSTNNNNIADATDYNNEIDLSFQSTTFQTADSTNANADSFVSSTTAEPILCNEDIAANKVCSNLAPLSVLPPHSDPVYNVKSDTASRQGLCSQSSLSAAALIPPHDSMSRRNLFLPSSHERSTREQSHEAPNITRSDIKEIGGLTFYTHYPSGSFVTSTQTTPPHVTRNARESRQINEDITSNDAASSTLSSSTLSSSANPSIFSLSPSSKSSVQVASFIGKGRNIESDVYHSLPPGQTTVSSSNHDIPCVSSVPILKKQNKDPTVEQQSSQSLTSSSSPKCSGRRKSRKSAKPQKQIANMTYSDLITEREPQFGNPDLANPTELNMGFSSGHPELSLKVTKPSENKLSKSQNEKTVSKNFVFFTPNPSSPLDLSLGNSSSSSNDREFPNEPIKNNPTGAVVSSASCDAVKNDGKVGMNDSTTLEGNGTIVEKLNSEVPDNRIPGSRSPSLESSDSKVLVDFANNTMKELLGIYGFDGQDAKNVKLNNLHNFQPDKQSPVSSEGKSSSMPLMKKGESQPSRKHKTKFTKSGTFRRIVYTSLTQHASKPNTSSKTSDGQVLPTTAEAPQATPARTVKYAFSKKSYTQKVLNSADFTKCIRRYGTGIDCGGKVCQQLGYRDHYHCVECPHKAFIRKEETVRHYKWHKKRNDSLQHGFMRYSPMDDCSKKHGNCTHNGRQTHYHCVQGDCDKVYVSTSDVQMHANFHRKDSAIIQEGFQRFRATEDCGTTSCSFHGQRTTHFHCRRTQCHFTFKNKADMEKHKSYHQKDEVLSRDGFKKFMKYETCPYAGCRYSKINNHIHCIRPGCQYVLHSTAQLYSHKRKHERRELDSAYRSFRHLQQHQVPAVNLGIGVKSEGHNEVKNPSVAQAAVGHTKILPLLVSTAGNVASKPGISLQASGGDKVQALQIQSSSSVDLVHNVARKSIPDLSFALAGSLSSPKKTSLLQVARGQVGGVLNLTGKIGETKKDMEEPRQTLMLPVKSLGENSISSTVDMKPEPFSEIESEGYTKYKGQTEADSKRCIKFELKSEADSDKYTNIRDCSDEPEDLSMPKKKKESSCFKDTNLKLDISFKSEPDSDSLLQLSETFDDSDNDEDDDDDDDDDDDKDYGQVEEPTLVNTFNISLEGDKLNDSLNLAFPKQVEEMAGGTTVKKETSLNIRDVIKPVTQGAATNVIKVLSTVPETGEKVASLQADLYDRCSPLQQQTSQGAPQAILTSKGKVLGVHIPVRLLPERRERDESWKRYLIRYTANDACFSRCACLYKDHYHCRIDGCQVIFKSKDGVRGHARFHELQDTITPLVYLHYKPNIPCGTTECPYSGKDEHYHCNWTDCTHIIPVTAPTFYRLEHYRIHEYATASLSKNRTSFSSSGSRIELDPLQKRRGRPPKYPKYDLPTVPKVHLTEKEILDSTLAFMHNKSSKDNKIINGFKKFIASELCPDDQCTYKGKDHFHCGRKYCHMSTDRLDVLNLHAKDFHNNVTILDGYEFFERMVNCRRLVCQNNKVNRHFHCMRPRCDYSFVRHSTMLQHNKKHPTVTSAVLSTPVARATPTQIKTVASQFIPIAPAVTQTAPTTQPTSTPTKIAASPSCSKTVKSSGTYFPLSAVSSFKLGSLSSPSTTSTQILASASTGHVLPSTSLAQGAVASTQIISAAQVFHAQDGTAIFSTGTLLTLPHNLITTTIPLLAQSANGQQTSVLTGLIPVGQLSQHRLATPLVNIAGGQLIAASQGHVLQPTGGILGAGVVQVIRSPATITTNATSTPATISTLSGSNVAPLASIAPPLTFLLQQHPQQQNNVSVPLSWPSLKKRMHYSVNLSCGRPFCKLKKKDHYHCLDCNQAFSDPSRLRAHISKHGFKFKVSEHGAKLRISSEYKSESTSVLEPINQSGAKPMDLSVEADITANRNGSTGSHTCIEELSSSLNLQPSVFTSMVKHTDSPCTKNSSSYMNGNTCNADIKLLSATSVSSMPHQQEMSSEAEDNDIEDHSMSQISNSSDSKNGKSLDSPSLVTDDGFDDSNESSLDASSSSLTLCFSLSRKSNRKRTVSKIDSLVIPQPAKQRKMQWGVKNETDQPDGYKRVRCGEDCGHIRCAYRQTVTHFHCLRADCGYGFSDKSRIIQHRMRHERLDALMGGEFQQYRASVTCDRADCEFNEKASHFHCLKCPYSCADSSKVPAHRKYHTKLDNISNNGFIKYAGTTDCKAAACSYFRKQTHYHCTFPGCGHAVLGPSQMAPHKLKHAQHHSV